VPGGWPDTGVKVIPLLGLTVAVSVSPAELVACTVKVRVVPAAATAGDTVAEVIATLSVLTVTENGAEPFGSVTVPVIVIVDMVVILSTKS
jgi:hypothetical protein